ncbi:MAG: HAD family hydrolase [Bacteroidetes bacterium]|nr:MAG: HAD family hydrolase [Bacteroidota bacterium]
MKKLVINPKAKAIIFDLDGTLADTMPAHYLAWRETGLKYGVEFPEDLFYKWAGIPTYKIIGMLNEMFGSSMDPVLVDEEKEHAFLKHIDTIKPIQNVFELALSYHQKIPMSIGTGGIPEIVDKTLKAIDASHLFSIIVTAKDVKNHKPSPDTFLLCAERMGIAPEFCHVFEDGNPGIEAAKAAGMFVTDIRLFQ